MLGIWFCWKYRHRREINLFQYSLGTMAIPCRIYCAELKSHFYQKPSASSTLMYIAPRTLLPPPPLPPSLSKFLPNIPSLLYHMHNIWLRMVLRLLQQICEALLTRYRIGWRRIPRIQYIVSVKYLFTCGR